MANPASGFALCSSTLVSGSNMPSFGFLFGQDQNSGIIATPRTHPMNANLLGEFIFFPKGNNVSSSFPFHRGSNVFGVFPFHVGSNAPINFPLPRGTNVPSYLPFLGNVNIPRSFPFTWGINPPSNLLQQGGSYMPMGNPYQGSYFTTSIQYMGAPYSPSSLNM